MSKIWGISEICLILLSILSFVCAESVYDPTPGLMENASYAIGTCAVGLVCVQPPLGNWTLAMEQDCLVMVQEALNFFENLSDGCIDFILAEVKYNVAINQDPTEMVGYSPWVSEVFNNTGYTGTDDMEQARRYVNYLRINKTKADWAIAILMIDTTYDPEGNFGFGNNAFASAIGNGPYTAYAYHWDASRLTLVHEIAHLFGATDECRGGTEYTGYLNVPDSEGARCIMNSLAYVNFCNATREQIGWRDLNGNDIMDIIENKDKTVLQPYAPDPTTNRILMYRGTSYVIPYPSQNPDMRSVTTTKIPNVQFRVDSGDWMNATASDGKFDSQVEEFYFLTPALEIGSHTIEVRSLNTVGNSDENSAIDTVVVVSERDIGPPKANFTYQENVTIGRVLFDASASSSPNSTIASYEWDFGDGNITTTLTPVVSHVYYTLGNYTVRLNITNVHGLWDVASALIRVSSLNKSADVNGDGIVNIVDVATVARAFGSYPGHISWDPRVDFDDNNQINIIDIASVANMFYRSP